MAQLAPAGEQRSRLARRSIERSCQAHPSKLREGATTHAEVGELVDQVRAATADQILAGLSPDVPPPPVLRAAVHGWLWFMDGALMDWLEHRDVERTQLVSTPLGAVTASGRPGPTNG